MQNTAAYVVGIGGPVGAGKTTLFNCLCMELRDEYSIGVIVDDTHGTNDADYLQDTHILETSSILSVVTGKVNKQICLQKEDFYQKAIRLASARFDDLDIILIEDVDNRIDSRFARSIFNCFIYIIDASEWERLPPDVCAGISESEMLIVNKIDLLDSSSGCLGKLTLNIQKMRGTRTYVLAAIERGLGVNHIITGLQQLISRSTSEALDL